MRSACEAQEGETRLRGDPHNRPWLLRRSSGAGEPSSGLHLSSATALFPPPSQSLGANVSSRIFPVVASRRTHHGRYIDDCVEAQGFKNRVTASPSALAVDLAVWGRE